MKKSKKRKSAKYRYMSETFISKSMRDWLYQNGWGYRFLEPELHQHGVDIRVQNDQSPHTRYFYIEAKGASSARYANSVDDGSVVAVIGQIVSRMKSFSPNRYGIALPESCKKRIVARLHWRVAKRLLLSVFLVDKKGIVTHYSWKDLRKLRDA
jgi:hypothetical protein